MHVTIFTTGREIPTSFEFYIVTRSTLAASTSNTLHRHRPFLLSTWLGALFLIHFSNFARTMGFIRVTDSYTTDILIFSELQSVKAKYKQCLF